MAALNHGILKFPTRVRAVETAPVTTVFGGGYLVFSDCFHVGLHSVLCFSDSSIALGTDLSIILQLIAISRYRSRYTMPLSNLHNSQGLYLFLVGV
jgi:hypothetical protein